MTPHHGTGKQVVFMQLVKLKLSQCAIKKQNFNKFVFEGRQTMDSIVETDNSGVKRLLKRCAKIME